MNRDATGKCRWYGCKAPRAGGPCARCGRHVMPDTTPLILHALYYVVFPFVWLWTCVPGWIAGGGRNGE